MLADPKPWEHGKQKLNFNIRAGQASQSRYVPGTILSNTDLELQEFSQQPEADPFITST